MRALLATLLAALVSMHADAAGQPLRILAFGDSLTEGFTTGGARMYPYAAKLEELFKQDGVEVEVGAWQTCILRRAHACISPAQPHALTHAQYMQVVASGVSGERVLVTMRERLERELAAEKANGKK